MNLDEDGSYVEARRMMVENLRTIVEDQRVLEVMGRIPRHLFVPERNRAHAYAAHSALSIDENQTISHRTSLPS